MLGQKVPCTADGPLHLMAAAGMTRDAADVSLRKRFRTMEERWEEETGFAARETAPDKNAAFAVW